jgi:endoplasmic reticulum-Golgi intermediate compartment protein 3
VKKVQMSWLLLHSQIIRFQSLVLNFHIAPGRTYSGNNVHVHDMSPGAGLHFNLTHSIKHLSFGDAYQGMLNPLDGTMRVQEEHVLGAMFLSYIKIVPTKYTFYGNSSVLSTNQYSTTQHQRQVTPQRNNGLPGVSSNRISRR